MHLDGARRNAEFPTCLLIGAAIGDELEHLALSGRQLGEAADLDSTAAGCATASCHPSGRGASGYSATTVAELLSPGSQARFAGKCGVVRGDPDASFLIDKLLGRSGRRMPLELSPLSDAQLELFKRWISEGAPP